MEWSQETRHKLARNIKELSLEIQKEELARCANFPQAAENTIKRILQRLESVGFQRAHGDFQVEYACYLSDKGTSLNLYRDSETHLWFETAQARVVTIRKDKADKLLVLGLP